MNQQGGDYGTQYRSIILYVTEAQKIIAEKSKKTLEDSKKFSRPIVTEIKALDAFFPAETYHQNYYQENKLKAYCSIVISPKVKYLTEKYKELLR